MTDRRTPHERGRHIPADATGARGPVRDLGPSAGDECRHAFDHRLTEPAGVFEAVELASTMAEARVAPFLRTTPTPFVLGRAWVGLHFLDRTALPLFLNAKVLTGERRSRTYLMARTWADTGGDVHLDEHMAFVVANRLQVDFRKLLQATVFVRHYD